MEETEFNGVTEATSQTMLEFAEANPPTQKMVEISRLYVFLALFTFVYFLESIGGSYMVSAVQNIERQFRIPSKLSGLLVSAHDISYVPTVIFVSYFGSRGNRAKWIGAGTIVIALAHIFTASPNFVYPVHPPQLNITEIEGRLEAKESLLQPDATVKDFFEYAPIRDRVPSRVRSALLEKLDNSKSSVNESPNGIEYANNSRSLYLIDEPLISDILHHIDLVIKNQEDKSELLKSLKMFVQNRQEFAESDLKTIRRAAIAPFAFCHRMVNDLRQVMKEIQCHGEASNVGPLLIIFVALLALGVGRTMPWSLGIPLIDDNVKNKNMPVYFAMMSFIRIMGPICGFLIGSVANKLYYTFPQMAPRGLTPQDPTWIGAWWLGFLFIGIITIIPSVMLYFFPESSKKKNKVTVKNGDLHNGDVKKPLDDRTKLSLFDRHVDRDEDFTTRERIHSFLGSYYDVLKSKVYVGSVVGRVCDVLAFKGYMVFLPKYLENHYGIPQYRVHLYMAVFGVLGFACGTAGGGFITRRFKLNGRSAAFYVLLMSVINTSLFFSKSFLGCHSIVNNVGLSGIEANFNYTKSCNSECGCESAKLFPVCDATGRTFYSPCHAGCRHVSVYDLESYQLEFSECDCAPGGIVKKEFCHDNCKEMTIAFFTTVILGAFVAGTAVVPGMLLLLRSVPPASRSPALGLNGFLVSFFGTLPSPILWGTVIDSSCLVWESVCGSQGSCQIYDPTKLRVRMHYLYVAIRLVSMLTDLYVLYHAKGLNIQEEDDDNNDTEVEAEQAVGKVSIAMNPINAQ